MINYISKKEGVEKLKEYFKTIDSEQHDYYIKTSDIDKYIYSYTFNFHNILKKYITEINKLLEYYFDSDLFLLNTEGWMSSTERLWWWTRTGSAPISPSAALSVLC